MPVIELEEHATLGGDLVGPVIRAGALAEAVIAAVEEDNPGHDVVVVDRDDYVRIHTSQRCRLSRASLEKHYGQRYPLSLLEIDMPAFKGRLRTRMDEYVWFYDQ
jgi:toluene monooxygenase system protein D